MAKIKMVCPITKGPCVECAIYRGRHFYMCFSKEYQGVSLGAEQIDELKAQYKSKDNSHDKKFGMPADVHESSRWIRNVEDLTDRVIHK
jgi:hypothetical protein